MCSYNDIILCVGESFNSAHVPRYPANMAALGKKSAGLASFRVGWGGGVAWLGSHSS